MAFDAYLGYSGSTVTVHLSGDLADRHVPSLRQLIDQALQRPVSVLVLRMRELTSLSPGGVRCLAFAQQRMARGAEIVLDGASEDVLRVLRAGGFDRAVTVVEELPGFDERAAA